jgi:hypothetical protein
MSKIRNAIYRIQCTRLYQHFNRMFSNRLLRSGIFWWLALAISAFMISAVLAIEIDENKKHEPSQDKAGIVVVSAMQSPNTQVFVRQITTFLLGASLGFGIAWYFCGRRTTINSPAEAFPHFRRSMRTDLISGITVILLISPISIWLYLILDRPHSFMTTALTNPGGFFALLTGAGTLIGTYIAIQSILEMKHTITSYPQLVDRLKELIREAGDSHDGVIFLTYSPLPGSWQLRGNWKNQLKKWMTDKRRCIRAVCLTEDDHLRLLMDISSRGTPTKPNIDPEETVAFQRECDSVLNILETKGKRAPGEPDADIDAQAFQVKPTRLTWKRMPGYYFFASEKRAIIVIPIGISQLDDFVAFSQEDLRNVPLFAKKLISSQDPVSEYLLRNVSNETQQSLRSDPLPETIPQALARDIEKIISGGSSIYDEKRFAAVALQPETKYLLEQNNKLALLGQSLALLNRLLVQDAYPESILNRYKNESTAGRTPAKEFGRVGVQTLGFETTDRHIIETLHREFEKYAEPVTIGARGA